MIATWRRSLLGVQGWAARAALLALTAFASQPNLAHGEDEVPTSEQLRAFSVSFNGASRPDLVPFFLKIRRAVNDSNIVERLKETFTPQDVDAMQAFRSGVSDAESADAELVNQLYRQLCARIEQLDGKAVATEIKKMDSVVGERRDARARAFVESLTPEAAAALLAEAEQALRTVGGVKEDVVALASQYPDFFKERVKKMCVARGFIGETR